MISVQRLSLAALASKLNSTVVTPPLSQYSLREWQMERDDAPIFRFLYEHFQPRRHLEFGTWQGFGTCLCLESCHATVWTLNVSDGETKPDGSWAYSERVVDESSRPPGAVAQNFGQDEAGPRTYHRTDAGGYIGRFYRERNFGHRVCQIFCDSRKWDIMGYAPDFFDSVLIDGGHQTDVVLSDTRKALSVLRPGGVIMWHDYCPKPEVRAQSAVIRGVTDAIEELRPELHAQLVELFWIDPSMILLGIKQ